MSESLLQKPRPTDDAPERRLAYSPWVRVLVSLFVAYQAATLIVHNLPRGGFAGRLHRTFNKYLKSSHYYRITGLAQSWAMFAPNPHRLNNFMRVYVVDAGGQPWDLKHDIYGRRTFPYLFYDRMGKINRRIIETAGYRKHYAAWVCRSWELAHGGQLPQEVRFERLWTRIPPPERAYEHMGFHPGALHLHRVQEERFDCSDLVGAQTSNEIRARHDLPPRPEEQIRGHRVRSWHFQKELREEADARRKAYREGREP